MPKKPSDKRKEELAQTPEPIAQAKKSDRFAVLLDMEWWEYQVNKDYTGTGTAMIATAKAYARDQGYSLNVNKELNTASIFLQLREPTEDELRRSELRQVAYANRKSRENDSEATVFDPAGESREE